MGIAPIEFRDRPMQRDGLRHVITSHAVVRERGAREHYQAADHSQDDEQFPIHKRPPAKLQLNHTWKRMMDAMISGAGIFRNNLAEGQRDLNWFQR
jgi:hypothetical protein